MALQGCLPRKMIWGENSREGRALDRSAFTEAATKAIALVRRRCMGNLSLEFTVLNQWKHRGERTHGKVRT